MLFLPVALAALPPVQQEENMLSGGGCTAPRPPRWEALPTQWNSNLCERPLGIDRQHNLAGLGLL